MPDFEAKDGTRTRDINLGKVALYQLSYFRIIYTIRRACPLQIGGHYIKYPRLCKNKNRQCPVSMRKRIVRKQNFVKKPAKKGNTRHKFLYILPFLGLFAAAIGLINGSVRSFEVYPKAKMRKKFAAAGLAEPIIADFIAQIPQNREGYKTQQKIYKLRYYLSENLGSNPAKPIFYLIHGSPGGAVNFMQQSYFLNRRLRKKFVLLAPDRLGYGKSTPKEATPELEAAAAPLLAQLYDLKMQFPRRRIYALGWSYGGPILALLAHANTRLWPGTLHKVSAEPCRLIDGVIFVASPADPQHEKFWWFNPILQFRVINWLFVSGINVANIEKMAHPAELEKLRPLWSEIKIPAAYLQGTQDRIVLQQNLDFLRLQAQKAGPQSRIYEIEGGEHGIVFGEVGLILEILEGWL